MALLMSTPAVTAAGMAAATTEVGLAFDCSAVFTAADVADNEVAGVLLVLLKALLNAVLRLTLLAMSLVILLAAVDAAVAVGVAAVGVVAVDGDDTLVDTVVGAEKSVLAATGDTAADKESTSPAAWFRMLSITERSPVFDFKNVACSSVIGFDPAKYSGVSVGSVIASAAFWPIVDKRLGGETEVLSPSAMFV